MKKQNRIIACLLAAVLLYIFNVPLNVYAAKNVELSVEITYGQTEARSMLEYINEFRTSTLGTESGDGAWYWNQDNNTKTVFNTAGAASLNKLTYDYELEQVAQQRALEAAIQFSHTRPNGDTCFSIYPSLRRMGENLAAGSHTAYDAYFLLREDSYGYSGQGHRRNMLDPGFNVIGIGHVVMDGIHYWAHVLGYRDAPVTSATVARNDTAVVSIEIASDALTLLKVYPQTSDYVLSVGEFKTYPKVIAEYTIANHWPSNNIKCYPTVSWGSKNPSVVSANESGFKAVAVGNTQLQAAVNSDLSVNNVIIEVRVNPIDISDAEITLEYNQTEYTGNFLKPKVTSVKLDSKKLTEGTDYTVSYSNNRAIGSAEVAVSGKGNYSGSAAAKFRITECTHILDDGTVSRKANCVDPGEMIYECRKCDFSKKEIIPVAGHIPGDSETCSAPQICTVCGTSLIPATGNHIDDDNNFRCDMCGIEIDQRLPGDVNSDGRVNMMDVTILCRYLAEWDGVVINESNSDVNGDDRVNMMDVTVLCRYLAEWDGVVLK